MEYVIMFLGVSGTLMVSPLRAFAVAAAAIGKLDFVSRYSSP